ncbi:MAG: GDSL-type esterase/lipase family protein [Fimbriimonas sp.]|nr:GDSL-type esterase/lipase family protein [Fimbriimonas sp.]
MICALSLALLLHLRLVENPATVPVQQRGFEKLHEERVSLVTKHKYDLLMIGDSITHNFERDIYQPIWRQFYKPRNAMNLGYSGARTENILWNLQNGELTNQSPKVAVLMIGTNNADETNYPTHHTSEQIAGGVTAIVQLLRKDLPKTKILLLACFPFGEHPDANSRGQVLRRASEMFKSLGDDKYVYFLDIGHVFLKPDGSVNKLLMPDYLHPSVTGALLWAKAMEPLLCKLMGDESRDVTLGGR